MSFAGRWKAARLRRHVGFGRWGELCTCTRIFMASVFISSRLPINHRLPSSYQGDDLFYLRFFSLHSVSPPLDLDSFPDWGTWGGMIRVRHPDE